MKSNFNSKMIDPPLIGAIIAVLGIVVAYWTQRVQNQQTEADNKELRKIITNKTGDIAKLTQEIQDFQKGGDSYCYLNVIQNISDNTARLYIVHRGKYPLNKLKICMTNTSSFYGNPITEIKEISKKQWSFDIESVELGDDRPFADIYLPNSEEEIILSAGFTARNGTWYQHIVFSKLQTGIRPPEYRYPAPYSIQSKVYKYTKNDQNMPAVKIYLDSIEAGANWKEIDWSEYKVDTSCDGMQVQ